MEEAGKRMPVSVTLGGDPVYTYCATAPLPENISEYILAGFLRKKRVKLVKCITNDLYVPADADIVIEGYVDPAEELCQRGSVWRPYGLLLACRLLSGFSCHMYNSHSKKQFILRQLLEFPLRKMLGWPKQQKRYSFHL